MSNRARSHEPGVFLSEIFPVVRYLVRWVPIASAAGVLGGSASALLLVSLAWATGMRESHRWLIGLLPIAGLLVGCLYKYFGTAVEAGTNLILDEIHDPDQAIPLRMTPMILLGTFLTHLFGGSAGAGRYSAPDRSFAGGPACPTVSDGGGGTPDRADGGYQRGVCLRVWDTSCGSNLWGGGAGDWWGEL